MWKQKWWLSAAGLIGLAMAVFGIGNLLGDDGGPLYGKIVAAAAAVAFADLILGGLAVRDRNEARGSLINGCPRCPRKGSDGDSGPFPDKHHHEHLYPCCARAAERGHGQSG